MDSSLLLATARDAAGKDVIVATARLPIDSSDETDETAKTAKTFGARHALFQSHEIEVAVNDKETADDTPHYLERRS